jgi:hypothetical protein
MYRAMGANWAGTFVAFLAVIFVPCPILLYIYGKKIRRMTKPGRDADDLGHMLAKMMAAQAAAAAGAAAGAGAAGAAAAPGAAPAADKRDNVGVHLGVTDEEAVIEGLEDPIEGRIETVPQLERTLTRMTMESTKSK